MEAFLDAQAEDGEEDDNDGDEGVAMPDIAAFLKVSSPWGSLGGRAGDCNLYAWSFAPMLLPPSPLNPPPSVPLPSGCNSRSL